MSLKKKVLKGTFWSGIDKISSDTIQFVVTIIMARMLLPDDYGTMGILLVFISFSSVFVDGGMATALIQKVNRKDSDFYTAFIYNIVVAIVVYILIFLVSPYVAQIYHRQDIELLLKILSLNIIITAFASIQTVIFTINLDFRKICKASIVSGILSGILGIGCAYKGFGIWAIVIQQLSYQGIRTFIMYCLSFWHPYFCFSRESFNELFSFGYKLVITNILAKTYENLYPLAIGKFYPMNILGYYTRAEQFSNLPASILNQILMRVSFPVMSSIKEDKEKLSRTYRIYIRMSSFVVFPIMFVLIIISKPLVLMFLTEKWLPTVPFLQLLCLGAMFNHISSINLNLLFVMGRSDLALRLEIIKKTIAISIFVFSTLWGVWGICIGQVVYSFLATMLNSIYTYRIVGISYVDQFKDFINIWILSFFVVPIPWILSSMSNISWIQILIGVSVYFIIYSLFNFLLNTDEFKFSCELLKNVINVNSSNSR